MIDKIFSLGKGYATKVGLIGLLLTALGGAAAQFAANPCQDLACWIELGKAFAIAIGGFGVIRKLLPFLESQKQPAL